MKIDRDHSARALLMILANVLSIAIVGVAMERGAMAGAPRNSPVQENSTYTQWIADYRRGPLQFEDGPAHAVGGNDGPVPVVVVTAIEGDELKTDEKTVATFGPNYQIVTHGCSVSAEGRVGYFQHRFDDSKAGGYPVIS